ncbi:PmoA family protein [Daejeonella sp.]|uniref:DUF6807 domain-containing protein n=1 Tax=Daejeonella sp. TaxID=2805397 RepID=UPI0039838E43
MTRNFLVLFSLAMLAIIGLTRCNAQMPRGSSERFKITENKLGKRIDISIDGKPFTSYIYPDELMKPVLYPLRTSQGTLITRGWPMDPRPGERVDHPHHVGLWFNYGDVNGLDFWNNSTDIPASKKNGFGTIKHSAVRKMTGGNNNAELEVTMDWQKPDGTKLLTEETKFIFSEVGATRTIERITTLKALGEDISFKDNKEGLLGIRLARELEHPSKKAEIFTDATGKATSVAQLNNEGIMGKYRSSEGKEGDDVWGTRGNWVNLNSKIGAEPISLVILDHPTNIGYPTYWHARGYGLFSANPLGQKEMSAGKQELNFKLPAGKSVTFRYKVLIHSGSNLSDEQVKAESNRFAAQK